MITQYDNGWWIHEEERQRLIKWASKKLNRYLFHPEWFNDLLTTERKTRRNISYPTCYFAYIKVGNTEKLAYVTTDHQQAFKIDYYTNTYIPYKRFAFVRWCSTMDL